MSKDSGRLSRVGVLAPAALSACIDASVLAVPAAGAIVSTLLKELSKAFMLKKWFHGVMSAKEAELLLLERGKAGSYLVRESQAHPGELVLSVRVRARVAHVMIRRQHNKYDVGSGEQFEDLVGLVEHCRAFPLREGAGEVLRLLQPVAGAGAGGPLRARRLPRNLLHAQETDDSQNLDYKCGFEREFQSIRMLEERHVFTTVEGNKPENASKNRYRNIVPYDQTRVALRARREGADYINASYIRALRLSDSASSLHSSNESLDSIQSLILADDLPKTSLVSKSLSDETIMEVKRSIKLDMINENICQSTVKDKFYIATQGCLSSTIDDFWQMVWQEDIRVIAMLTNEVEKEKNKCERYWPAPGQQLRCGELVVQGVAETGRAHRVLRELTLCRDNHLPTTIYHYQFTMWPDHGTPLEPGGVLALVDEVNQRIFQIANGENPPEQNILCVHCSAGVGRTGTFIALDILIDQIRSSGVGARGWCAGAVFQTARLVRAQRPGMVQNRAQYRFIYIALKAYMDRHTSNTIQTKAFSETAPALSRRHASSTSSQNYYFSLLMLVKFFFRLSVGCIK